MAVCRRRVVAHGHQHEAARRCANAPALPTYKAGHTTTRHASDTHHPRTRHIRRAPQGKTPTLSGQQVKRPPKPHTPHTNALTALTGAPALTNHGTGADLPSTRSRQYLQLHVQDDDVVQDVSPEQQRLQHTGEHPLQNQQQRERAGHRQQHHAVYREDAEGTSEPMKPERQHKQRCKTAVQRVERVQRDSEDTKRFKQ